MISKLSFIFFKISRDITPILFRNIYTDICCEAMTSLLEIFSLNRQVVVQDGEGKSFEFPCNRWLSKTEDDGKISRDLILSGSSGIEGSTGNLFSINSYLSIYISIYQFIKLFIDFFYFFICLFVHLFMFY